MEIKNIGVVGAGQMGSGIALTAARNGHGVVMQDITESVVQKGMESIAHFLDKEISKGRMSAADKSGILQRIIPSANIHDLQSADFVIEAATENEPIKFEIFRKLDRICPLTSILSTNTSAIPIGRIALQTSRPDKVIGMHFMNPAPVMKLVEIIRSVSTSDETFQTTYALAESLGKTPAESGDFPGFISNRILMVMINEAIFTLHEGIGTRESIDTVMQLGMNHPMGPLALADFMGLDTCLAILGILYEGFKDPKFRPCPLLRQYVEAGWLGRKTGRGFYSHKQR
jgi:3-hydroxybutyryl-CoA dehydrogenase